MALAFEVPGGWHQERDATVLTLLQVVKLALGCFSLFICLLAPSVRCH